MTVVAKAELAQSYMHQLKMIFRRLFSMTSFIIFSRPGELNFCRVPCSRPLTHRCLPSIVTYSHMRFSLLRGKLCSRWHQNFQWKRPIPNSKHETRNSKQIQIFQIQNSFSLFAIFELLNFEFVSDFDIRIFRCLMPVWFRLCRVRRKSPCLNLPSTPARFKTSNI